MIDEIARYLTDGYWEAEGNKRHAFDVKPGGTLKVKITALTEDGQQLARWALEAWTNVSGIKFEFVENNANIIFDDNEDGANTSTTVKDGVIVLSEVNITADWLIERGNTIDSFTFFAYIHEIGHALGLGHPGPYDGASVTYGDDNLFSHDSWQFSVMSYFLQSTNTNIDASGAYPITPMIADIVAIQDLYGSPKDSNAGDTVYGYESNVEGYMAQFFDQWNNYNGKIQLSQSQLQGENSDSPVGDNPFLSRLSHPFSHIMGSSVRLEAGSPAFADLDDDGDLDLIFRNNNFITYFENTGTATNPHFVEWSELGSLDVGEGREPTLADLDNDGDFDLAVGKERGAIDYFENTGTSINPDFVKRTGSDNPFISNNVGGSNNTPEFVDIDGDGDFDVVSGNIFGFIMYLENTGTKIKPQFTQRTGVDNPFDTLDLSFLSNPALADIDGDGDFDLLVGSLGVPSDKLYYFENLGTATSPVFIDSPVYSISAVFPSPVFADIDGDGDPDLIVGGSRFASLVYFEHTGTRANPISDEVSGANKSVALTLYDSNGTDTLDLRTDMVNQRVDLRPEGISNVYGLVGNLVIARNTLIENYVAGAGDDIIVGNEADNVLEGSAGDDDIDGDAGSDTAAYTGSDAAVTVNLSNGTATGGDAQGDSFTSIENLTGSAFDDTLIGDTADNVLEGAGGGDTLDGGDGADTASWAASDAAISVDLSAGTNTGGHAAGDTLTSIENLLGSRYSDVLTGDAGSNRLAGSAGNDRLEGRAGADTLVGGHGLDTASYAASAVAVTVNLETGAASGGDATGDTLDSIEYLSGSAFDDTLTGNAGNNVLSGRAGADALDGGEGIDTASYAGSDSRVDVRLSGTVVNYGDATGDTLTGIENLIGSNHNDILVGDGQANALTGRDGNDLLWGSSGDDLLTGGTGADRLVGGAGLDTASWSGSLEAVTVRLHSLATAGGDAQGDTFPYLVDVTYTDAEGVEQTESLPDVENLIGSGHNDILAGDRRDNDIDGLAGDDTLYGGPGGGDDVINGGSGNDSIFGGQGDDTLIGGPGDDRLAGGPGADVFVFGPGDGADTVTDFSGGADKIDLTVFDIENIEDVVLTTGDDGVTVDLSGIDGGSILLAGLTTLPDAGDFLV